MNCTDGEYRELMLLLEQIESVDFNDTPEEKHHATKEKKNTTESNHITFKTNHLQDSPESRSDTEDITLNLQLLLQLNEAIKTDVSELLAKSDQLYLDDRNSPATSSAKENHFDHDSDLGTTVSDFGSDSLSICTPSCQDLEVVQVVHAGTQTSPSHSGSSTNLTWESTSESEGDDNWIARLPLQTTKFSSAPVLEKASPYISLEVSKQCRSQSDRHLAEIEAAEACKWLRATGFPQYAQLYEDMQFPIDIATAAQDHPFLDGDVLHALFRRLQILNSCAHIHQQQRACAPADESEDENCALSENWTYQSDIRRWSRVSCKSNLDDIVKKRSDHENVPCFDHYPKDEDEAFEKSTQSPKDRLRRAGSNKFRRRKEALVFSSEKNSPIHQRCGSTSATPTKGALVQHRRARTKSFDKTETWDQIHDHVESVIWGKLTENERRPIGWQRESSYELDESVITVVGVPVDQLSASQLQVLRKLALLKLTSHMEKYCPSHRTGWNWDLPKFLRKIKGPIYKDKNVFGVPLSISLQRCGQALPKNIEEALRWLLQNATDQVGIFRKPGVKSRIQLLRNMVESKDCVDFIDQQPYDVADMVKQYFRELPESLLTNKLSETFILIFQYVPVFLRMESITCAILLMPEEHTEVLKSLLHFLLLISKHSEVNQMNENNLAMCFAPSLFSYTQAYKSTMVGSPHPKDLAENKAAQECLYFLLKHFNSVFKVPQDFIRQCKSSEMKEAKAKQLNDLGVEKGGWGEYLDECQTNLIKETKDKPKGWVVMASHYPKVEISYKKVADGIPLRLWKVAAEIDAPPTEVLHRILRERHIWDQELRQARTVAQLDSRAEIFQFVRGSVTPRPTEEYCVLRRWSFSLARDNCILVETSVEHPDAQSAPSSVRGLILASRYLVEPCGAGKSKLVHLSRTDTMGRAPDWYQKHFGHLQALFMANIQSSFHRSATGPESNV